jgi:alpha-tubulin suppressor-like RCC1 family protein
LLNKKLISLSSGNAYNDLFCGVTGSDVYCDPHGTAYNSGQTGSNYTSGTISGAQHVYMDGWLLGKNILDIGVGSDFACILAETAVGCWGLNTGGQVGDGTTTNRNVPTPVDISITSDLGESVTSSVGAGFNNPISF